MNLIPITDLDDKRLDVYARFSETQLHHIAEYDARFSKEEYGEGIFIAESPLVFQRAIAQGYEPISILICDKDFEKEKASFREFDIPVFVAPFEVLTRLTGFALTRGLLSAMKRKRMVTLEELVLHKRRIAVLENVMNPTNVGAIIRSAAALGMEAIVLTGDCSDPLYRRAIRVSMGNVFHIPFVKLSEKNGSYTYVKALQALGFKTAAMALSDDSVSISCESLKQEERLAIILGQEGYGLVDETIQNSDYVVKIPMAEGVDSLNVAAASALAFWELR